MRGHRRVHVLVDGGDGEDGRGVVEVVAQRRVEVVSVDPPPSDLGGIRAERRHRLNGPSSQGDVTADYWPSEGKIRIRKKLGWDGDAESTLTSCTHEDRRGSLRLG